jgi:hypothetical protein
MNILLFIVTVVISFVVVRIGAIAFHITGLPKSAAQFQALSCFSGTGFTTRESELIMVSRQRRRIAAVLMIMGNAGFITMIAAFVNTLRTPTFQKTIPIIHVNIPGFLFPWINLLIVLIALYIINKIINHTRLGKAMLMYLRSHLLKRELVKPVDFEELLVSTGGYGVVRLDVSEDNPVAYTALQDGTLRRMDITLLAIERGKKSIPNPSRAEQIFPGDVLICFGNLETIHRNLIYQAPAKN